MEFLSLLENEPARAKVLASKAPGVVIPISYYEFEGQSEVRRIAFLTQAIPWVFEPKMPEALGPWVYSCVDALYPGAVKQIFDGTLVKVRGRSLTADELRFLADGTQALTLLPDCAFDAGRRETTILELAGFFASMMFAIAKKPTRENLTAFTEKRPKAFRGQFALTDDKVTWFGDDARMFGLPALSNIYGYFSGKYEERKHLVTEFISWSESGSDLTRVAMGNVAKLWAGQGENHIRLIHKFLLSYGRYLVGIPVLAEEARRFCVDFRKTGASSQGSFDKAIKGDRAMSIYSRNYPELFKLAREIAARMDESMSRYASGANNSAFLADFELACANATPPAALPAAIKMGEAQ